jgi:hypothetical protein
MSAERLAEAVSDIAHRRGFLKRAGAASLGLMGLSGLAPATAKAHYYHIHGCHLCNSSVNNCGPEYVCSWCWRGECHGSTRHWHYCCEGYRTGGDRCASGACSSYCSFLSGKYYSGC